jgi:hypothetical protein
VSPWARIDDGFDSNPKVEATSLAGRGLFVSLVSYSARHLTDGVVPESIVGHHVRGRGGRAALIELLERGFLFRLDDGRYGIHDYLDYNPARAKVEADRAADREKKERQRARRRQSELPWSAPRDTPGASPRGDAGMGGGSTATTEENGTDHSRAQAPGLIGEVMTILRRCSRLSVPDHCEPAIESAIAGAPGKDPVAAAHTAVTWASDPAWRKTWGPSVLGDALRKQEPGVKAKGDQSVLRSERTCARCKVAKVPPGYGAYCEKCSEELAA